MLKPQIMTSSYTCQIDHRHILLLLLLLLLLFLPHCALADLIPIYLLREQVITHNQRPLEVHLLTLII